MCKCSAYQSEAPLLYFYQCDNVFFLRLSNASVSSFLIGYEFIYKGKGLVTLVIDKGKCANVLSYQSEAPLLYFYQCGIGWSRKWLFLLTRNS
jgi:hypothetical protein